MDKKPLDLVVAQRRLTDNYKTYRMFRPRTMDPKYARRFRIDALYWMKQAGILRQRVRDGRGA